jgi:hypothetical protein
VGCYRGIEQPVKIVIMTRDALSSAFQFTLFLKPSPLTLKDDYLIPKGPLRCDRRNLWNFKMELRQVLRDVRAHDEGMVWIEG